MNFDIGEKPWQCGHCPKAFLHKESFKAHERRHKGEKPFSCEFCSKAFTEVWALKKHKRLHTGEKPYKCKDCGKCFADSSNLAKHCKAHVRAGDEITAKDGTVWNIINQQQQQQTSLDDANHDVHQIIYIAYDDQPTPHQEAAGKAEEASIHILSHASQLPSADDDSQLELSYQAGSAPTTATFHVQDQPDLSLDDAGVQYVDLAIKEGQQVRLRVPLDADPIAYAKEYLQSLSPPVL